MIILTILKSALKSIGPRDYVIVVIGAGLVFALTMWHNTSADLKKTQLVYANPQIKIVEKVVYKQGPVRIVTKIKEIPGKEIETVIVEERAPVETETVSSSITTPVPLSVAMADVRTDRYLLTLGMNRLTPDKDGKALFVGYGIKNRFDIQVGGVEHDGFSPWLFGTIRF